MEKSKAGPGIKFLIFCVIILVGMAIAYIVASWLLVQAADLVMDVIGAADWVLRSVVVLLALGFLPAVIISWVFEMTPEGVKKE